MFGFLDSSAFLVGAKALSSIAVGGSAIAVISNIVKSYMALQAKHKARIALSSDRGSARKLNDIVTADKQKNTAEDIDRVLSQLKYNGSTLSSSEIKFIEKGLEQPSRAGAQRYANEILGAARSA